MHTLRCTLGICLPLLICHSVLFPDEPKKEPTDAIGKLLNQLGDPRYVRREEATKQLIQLGESVLDRVRQHGRQTGEYDVLLRCQQVVRGVLRNSKASPSTGMKFALIDAGRFTMGSNGNEMNRRGDEPAHDIEITEPFVMGVYEVTQEEYEKVMKRTPSWFARTGKGKDKIPVTTDSNRYPVEQVTWFEAVAFCNELSRKDGYRPYYKITDARTRDGATIDATVEIEGGNGYHLPTEAQWEYACRAKTTLPFHFGTRNRGKEANTKPIPATGYGDGPTFQALNQTITVGNYPANAWGLYDVCGNAGEWCWDWYDKDYYIHSPAKDPTGPKEGKHRVIRGGSWMVLESSCRSASRFFATPDTANSATGFRVIRRP